MQLTKIQKDIIKFLIDMGGYVPVDRIANHFVISAFEVKYELNWIEIWLNNKNIKLVKSLLFGVKIAAEDEDSLNKIFEDEAFKNESSPLPPEERRFFIASKMLMEPGTITINQLSEKLKANYSTIMGDIYHIETKLDNYNLELIRRSSNKIYLNGDEQDIRKFGVDLLNNGLENGIINIEDVMQYLQQSDVENIKNTMYGIEKKFKIGYHDDLKTEILLLFLVSFRRMLLGCFIKSNVLGKYSNEEYSTIKELTENIKNKYRISIPDEEIKFLTRVFPGSGVNPKDIRTDYEIKISNESAWFCREILNDIDEEFGISFKDNLIFVSALNIHLNGILAQAKDNNGISGTFVQHIKSKYPFIFDTLTRIIAKYKEILKREITLGDIANIAELIGNAFERYTDCGFLPRAALICERSSEATDIFANRFSIMFPEIKLIEAMTLENAEEAASEKQIDFGVSIIDINIKNLEVLVVNPLIDNDDIYKIRDMVFKTVDRKKSERLPAVNSSVTNE